MTDTVTPKKEAVAEKSTADVGDYAQGLDPDEDNESEQIEETLEIRQRRPSGSRLPWLLKDFEGITDNVYEAIMVAASRARQVGRRQKQEIDLWYKSHEPVDGAGEEEESEPGVDHFQHTKPTVKAMDELTRNVLQYKFPEIEE